MISNEIVALKALPQKMTAFIFGFYPSPHMLKELGVARLNKVAEPWQKNFRWKMVQHDLWGAYWLKEFLMEKY